MFIRKTSIHNLVRCLGKLQVSEEDMQLVKSVFHQTPNIDVTTLLNLIKIQGVTPQVYHNLQTLKAQGFKTPFFDQFLPQIQQILEKKRAYIDGLFSNLVAFVEAAGGAGTRFMVVKGMCFQQLYPTKSFRDMWDIDLVISPETAWKGINAFKQIRCRPKRIRLESYPYSNFRSMRVADGTFGIAQMLDLDGDPKSYPFDLHLGGFPGCGDGLLESDLWKRALPLKMGTQEILMPSLEDCILIICSHASRHGYAKTRDLNDIYVCLKHAGNGFDWDYLSHFSRKNSLQAILYGLLARLGGDDEVELPREVLSNLKPKGFENLASKALFSPGRENLNFQGRRQLVFGRFLQASFLYSYCLDRAGSPTALKESLFGLYFLFQNGRPYRIWKTRKIRSFHSNQRIVIVPIEVSTNKTSWHIERIHLQKVEQFALKSGVSVEWISNDVVVWNAGHLDELILTPEGVYTQSAYNGDIDKVELEKIQRAAWDLTVQLNEIGAIRAKRVKTYRAAGVPVK